jgi:hypothetical protein
MSLSDSESVKSVSKCVFKNIFLSFVFVMLVIVIQILAVTVVTLCFPEGGCKSLEGTCYLQSVGIRLQDYMVSHHRRLHSKHHLKNLS